MGDALLPRRMLEAGPLPRGRIGRLEGTPGVRLKEITGFAAAMIVARKGQAQSTAARLTAALGVVVEDGPKRSASGDRCIAGIAPGQWLAVKRDSVDWDLAQKLATALDGAAAVTAQGHGRIIVEVSGPRARAALAKGIPVDLHPGVFGVGAVAQTTAGHIGVGVALLEEGPTFELISNASTRVSLITWLVLAAAEFGLEVV